MIVDADEPLAQAARLRSDARRCRSFDCRITVELLADPIFMAVAVIGVCLLGISKGGFLGMGVMALPLMSLFVPPLQAAAIILPTAIAQDLLTLWCTGASGAPGTSRSCCRACSLACALRGCWPRRCRRRISASPSGSSPRCSSSDTG
jgi:hypothetical protein